MVNLGYVPSERRIPAPDMSFARLFKQHRSKWEVRGQYAIWTGSRSSDEAKYRLLERLDRNVVRVEQANGRQLMHRITAGTEFTIENLAGYWLTFDVDSIWIDVSSAATQHCVLLVGGSTEAEGNASVGWLCPKCGASVSSKRFQHILRDLPSFLNAADKLVEAFNADAAVRTCEECGITHPPSHGMTQDEPLVSTL
ncbi:hypothetical protein [Methylocella sp. CPCC 101449]|uniref:hypothetical protein n=1 Tax=Methylocella sp. CPCC 101449 TaxID=2987531 RepID=UPI00288DE035|nr:hypothetical protein [Methylocella sp. CPCC 101449]MDT2022573.1 hypothetical protein [Methylocella sp. CPCC 101449]